VSTRLDSPFGVVRCRPEATRRLALYTRGAALYPQAVIGRVSGRPDPGRPGPRPSIRGPALNIPPRKDTVVVVPCYNEASRLRPDLFREFVQATPAVSLLLVDDGSTDATAAVLEDLRGARPESIDVLRLSPNRGKAEAVRRGMLEALEGGARYVGYWDADLATPLDAVVGFREALEANPAIEILMGSRVKLLGRKIERRAARHYLGRVFATFASLTLRLPVYDTQCGAKMFRSTETLREVLSRPFEARWIFDVELLARFLRLRGRPEGPPEHQPIQEYPLPVWIDVLGSKIRPADWARAAVDLLRIGVTYR
jgi:glycosyltransferase involved in cell wall biosynthesis